MKTMGTLLAVAGLAATLSVAGLASAAEPQGEGVVASVEVTAEVVKINHETREVTLKGPDGQAFSFIASDEVRNLAQVQAGDLVTAVYTEAIAYEVRRGGQADVAEAVALGRAPVGEMPAGVMARAVVVTVEIIAIDRETPTVTFRGPEGNTKTVLVRHPERLEGVNVGDTVDIVYTEALAVRVDRAQ
jgi:hypothetical protein